MIQQPEIRDARRLSGSRPVGSDADADCSAPSEGYESGELRITLRNHPCSGSMRPRCTA